jgi:hypothetical protein
LEKNNEYRSRIEHDLHPDDAPDCPVPSFACEAEFEKQDGE